VSEAEQFGDYDDEIPGNLPEYTVSELAGSVKRAVEGAFDHVRVRGELGRVTFAKSGHVYVDLKDDRACIASVMWKTAAANMRVRPEEGMEVVVEGRLTTYAQRSQYQLIIEKLEPAGAGALMALLEERKKRLAAEGLFDDSRKQALPFLPEVIGVITSPTGAVIRDILHRLTDRFPRHVLLWPVLVQGDKAAAQVSAAIAGFNNYAPTPDLPRPDLIIVARGGGSIEDLWPFNEESVARAAAASRIPLISAIGHETDWTLLDFVADWRAPTPTGAAERAVPVRAELIARIAGLNQRTLGSRVRLLERASRELRAAVRALGRPEALFGAKQQQFDSAAARLNLGALKRMVADKQRHVAELGRRSGACVARGAKQARGDLARTERMRACMERAMARRAERLDAIGKTLEALNPKAPLSKGYALVHGPDGRLARSAAALAPGARVEMEFADGRTAAIVEGGVAPAPAPRKPAAGKPAARKSGAVPQGELF
jgi:exodeoxyribonuclease VII large subunit